MEKFYLKNRFLVENWLHIVDSTAIISKNWNFAKFFLFKKIQKPPQQSKTQHKGNAHIHFPHSTPKTIIWGHSFNYSSKHICLSSQKKVSSSTINSFFLLKKCHLISFNETTKKNNFHILNNFFLFSDESDFFLFAFLTIFLDVVYVKHFFGYFFGYGGI